MKPDLFEVVYYRNCDCGLEGCPGEKVTVLFQHKDKPQCIDFMLRQADKPNTISTFHYTDNKDKMDIEFYFGMIKRIKRLRVQKVLDS